MTTDTSAIFLLSDALKHVAASPNDVAEGKRTTIAALALMIAEIMGNVSYERADAVVVCFDSESQERISRFVAAAAHALGWGNVEEKEPSLDFSTGRPTTRIKVHLPPGYQGWTA